MGDDDKEGTENEMSTLTTAAMEPVIVMSPHDRHSWIALGRERYPVDDAAAYPEIPAGTGAVLTLTRDGFEVRERLVSIWFDFVNANHQDRKALIQISRMPGPHMRPLLEFLTGKTNLSSGVDLSPGMIERRFAGRWIRATVYSAPGFQVAGIETILGFVK